MMSVSAGLHVGGGDWRGVMQERCWYCRDESKRCDATTQKKDAINNRSGESGTWKKSGSE